MNHNIYNLYPVIVLLSETKIHLQSISLSHAYVGLMCGIPNEQINDNIVAEMKEGFEMACFIIKPNVTMISEDDFFGRDALYRKDKTIPLLPPVKVQALFECYEGEESTFLNIMWFQNELSVQIPIEEIIVIDWSHYAGKFIV